MNQNHAIATTDDNAAIMERVLIAGDLKNLSPQDRVSYYTAVCRSIGLNPMTKPFEYVILNGKLTLYALKGATDQLRANRGISIVDLVEHNTGDLYIVWATARDAQGRVDKDMGAASIKGLQGDALVNAMLKAITKAKRRVTLSLAGLGWLDETEVASMYGVAYPAPEYAAELDRSEYAVTEAVTDDGEIIDANTDIERTEIIQSLGALDDKRDLSEVKQRIRSAGLSEDAQVRTAYGVASQRLHNGRPDPSINDAQPALQGVS